MRTTYSRRLIARQRRLVLQAFADPPGGRAGGTERLVHGGPREPDARHVAVDRLVFAGAHAERLVPDADVAVVADQLVEAPPGRQVRRVRIAGVALELLERAPVLHQRRPGRPQALRGAQEARRLVLLQLAD